MWFSDNSKWNVKSWLWSINTIDQYYWPFSELYWLSTPSDFLSHSPTPSPLRVNSLSKDVFLFQMNSVRSRYPRCSMQLPSAQSQITCIFHVQSLSSVASYLQPLHSSPWGWALAAGEFLVTHRPEVPGSYSSQHQPSINQWTGISQFPCPSVGWFGVFRVSQKVSSRTEPQ